MNRRLNFLFVQINQVCNLKCNHCFFWKMEEEPYGFTDDQILSLIDEYLDLAGTGAHVVSCGGEPMLSLKRYFLISKRCRELDLRFLSVTNGSLIKTPEFAAKIVTEGPAEVTVSMDGPHAELHDHMRGVNGSFEVTKRAVELLCEARQKTGSNTRIHVMALVCQNIAGHLDEFHDLVLRQLKADKLKLNIMQPSFGFIGHDVFFGSEQPKDVNGLIDEIKLCDAKYGIDRNPEWLSQVAMYFQSVETSQNAFLGWMHLMKTPEHICDTYERNVIVDIKGNMRLCFSENYPSERWSRPGDLKHFWEETSVPIAESMLNCNHYCAISHSVRREPATLSGRYKKLGSEIKTIRS